MPTSTAAPVSPGPLRSDADGGARGRLGEWLPTPLLLVVGACVALAALSAAALPTIPSYDPWSWISWGREVSDPHLSFAITGGPSWKPLPFCFTTVYGLFGSAAPTLWVITARAAGLLGLVAAYRLGALLVGRLADSEEGAAGGSMRWAGPVAGLIAAGGVVLTQDWAYYMFRGTSEPMLIAAVLWAIDRLLAGRRGSAFVWLWAASLIRPEAWPFILLYGVWLGWHERRMWLLVGAGWVLIPVLWFVPPWIGSGQPLLAASHAASYNGHLGSDPFLTVLGRGAGDQLVPLLVLALAAVALAWRRRDRVVLGLGAAALAWWVIVVAMTLDGYPGLERFFLPAAAVASTLAGASIVALGVRAASLGGRPRAGRVGARTIAAGLTAALVAVCAAIGSGRISNAWAQRAAAAHAVTRIHAMWRAADALGGHRGVFPCRRSFAAVNHGVQTALAWKLHVTLGRVGTEMSHQGLDFVGPWDLVDGGPARVSRTLTQKQLVYSARGWRVYRLTAPGAQTRCVGG